MKKTLSLILAAVLTLSCVSAFASDDSNAMKMKIIYPDYANGEDFYGDVVPYEKDGELYLPLRAVCEKLNAQVEWNGTKRSATVTKNGQNFIPAEFVIENDRMFVKADVIKDFFAVDITTDAETNTVVFNTGKEYYAKWPHQERAQLKLILSNDDEYPDYLADEAANTVFDIQTHPSDNLASIAFITDFHYRK